MRKALLGLAVLAFVLFLPWKLIPFLKLERADIAATPTSQPADPTQLSDITVPRGKRVCVDGMPFGPDAHYVAVIVRGNRVTGPIDVVARANGYHARSTIPAGVAPGVQATAKIDAAPQDVADGTLCLVNRARHAIQLMGVNPTTRAASGTTTTVAGKKVPSELTVTLVSSGARSLWGQLGRDFDHIAAFRPVGSWFVALLFVLLLFVAPVVLAVALARAGGLDDAADREAAQPAAQRDGRGGS